MGFLKRLTVLVVGLALISTVYDLVKGDPPEKDTGGIKIIETVTAAVAVEKVSFSTDIPQHVTTKDGQRQNNKPIKDESAEISDDKPAMKPDTQDDSGLRNLYESSSLSVSRATRLRGHSFLTADNKEACLKYSDCLNGRGHVALAGMQFNLAKDSRQPVTSGAMHSVDRPAFYFER